MSSTLASLDPAAFALRCAASAGAAAYLVYVTPPDVVRAMAHEIQAELQALEPNAFLVEGAAPLDLLRVLHQRPAEHAVVSAPEYAADDWKLLDRRRSSMQRAGVTAIITSFKSFDTLSQVAPNLASWIGGEVFALPSENTEDERQKRLRDVRLESLRKQFGLTDQAVIDAAVARTLPRDPAFAEWLVLLGRGDLLDA